MKHLIFCLDNGEPVLATRQFFNNRDEAIEYMKGISPSRYPMVVDIPMCLSVVKLVETLVSTTIRMLGRPEG